MVEVKGRKDLAAVLALWLWMDNIVTVVDYNIVESKKKYDRYSNALFFLYKKGPELFATLKLIFLLQFVIY